MARRRLSTRAAHPEKVDYQPDRRKRLAISRRRIMIWRLFHPTVTKKTLERQLNSWRAKSNRC